MSRAVSVPGLRPLVAALAVGAMLLGVERAWAGGASLDLRHPVTRGDRVLAHGPSGYEALTLDPQLQRAAERLLVQSGAHEGAIVASDIHSGRILAWASRGDRDFVASAYAPSASLFKLVTATELLESGAANPDTQVCFEGGEHELRPADLEQRGGTCVPFREALGKSLNVVFAKLARDHLKAASIQNRATQLGFQGSAPIDVPTQQSVLHIPDDPFGMARASAGFWNGKTSPLSVLYAMQTIARGGDAIGFRVRESSDAPPSEGRVMRVSTANTLRRMLELTTRRGTCARAFHSASGARLLPDIDVAAKTGTLIGGSPPRMHSWFTAFAPAKQPEIAVAIFLGNDIRWTTKANVVGRQLLEAYFRGSSQTSSRKSFAQRH